MSDPRRFRPRLLSYIALLAVCLLIPAMAVEAYRSLDRLLRAAEWEVRAQAVLASIQHVGRVLREAESARRAYVLTGDEIHAEAHAQAAERVRAALTELQLLTSENARQQERLRELQPAVTARIAQLRSSIEQYRQDPNGTAVQARATRQGALADGPIQRLLDAMEAEEKRRLEERHTQALAEAQDSKRLIAASAAFTTLLLLGTGLVLFRLDARRRAAESDLAREEALLDSIFTQMGDGLVVTDAKGAFLVFNPAAERILGVGKLQSAPERWARDYRLFRPDGTTPFPSEELPPARALRGESANGVEMCVARPDGPVWISVGTRPLYGPAGEVTGAVTVFADVTERRRAAAETEAANARLTQTVDDLERLTAEKTLLAELADVLHNCRTLAEGYGAVARAAARLLPGSHGELLAVNPSQNHLEPVAAWPDHAARSGLFDPEDCWAVRRGAVHSVSGSEVSGACRHIANPSAGRHICAPLLAQEGTLGVLHLELSCGASVEADERTVTAVAHVAAPALMNIRLRDKLRHQSIRDPLTGLFNRRYMEESLVRELSRAQRYGRPVSVVMLDVDHFKGFNDRHGHAAGDQVLKELGALLNNHIRRSDIACRYGGEEFTLILPDSPMEDAYQRADALRIAASAMSVRLPGGASVSITVSQGVAAYPQHGSEPEPLLQAADRALYEAKQLGRNRVVFAPHAEA